MDFAALATKAREAGQTTEAISNYERALESRPDWREGWWYLGTLQYDADHYSEAIPAFEKLVTLDPGFAPGWNLLGLCEFEIRDYLKALAHLQKASTLDSGVDPETSRVAQYHLALLENREGEFEKASALLAMAFPDDTTDQIKFALGLSLLRVPLLPDEVNHSQDALVQSAGECARYLQKRDFSRAFTAFQDLIKNHPTTPYLHYSYGVALAASARYAEAVEQQQREQTISTASELPHIEISRIELQLKHPELALLAAKIAVGQAPHSSFAHQTLAEVLLALNKKTEASEEFRTAARLAPTQIREPRIIGLYSQPNLPSVASTASEAENFDQIAQRAASLQSAGNLQAAIENYEKGLAIRPEWEQGLWNLSTIYFATGAYDKAVSSLRLWMQKKPNDGTAWAMLGLSEFKKKDYENALIHLQRGQSLGFTGSDDSIRIARYHLAILLNRNSQFDQAFRVLGGIKNDDGDVEIQLALGMALLRMPLFPEQLDESLNRLVTETGQVGLLLQTSKYDQANSKLQALLKEYPVTPFLHYVYGTALASLSQYSDAELQFRKETTVSPASELPYIQRASIALRQFQPKDALPSGQRAVQLAPRSAEAHYILGRTYLELEQFPAAVRELEMGKELAPTSPEIRFNLAKAYAKSKLPEKAEQERKEFERLKSLNDQPGDAMGSQIYTRFPSD